MRPEDAVLFGDEAQPALRAASADLSFLLERGYARASSLKLVGDRYALEQRQRAAVSRCACSPSVARQRAARSVAGPVLRGATLVIDGFNVLTTVEVALAGGVVLLGRDGVFRDAAAMHGSFRRVSETAAALALIAKMAASLAPSRCVFLFDRAVSNSGRLRALVEAEGTVHQVAFEAEVVSDPDPLLRASPDIVASADGAVLDDCARWFNLARACVEAYVADARIVDLSGRALETP
jgi:hypothetical protein